MEIRRTIAWSLLIALMRRYTVVPRDPPVEQDARP
jgi:hypothetical protein